MAQAEYKKIVAAAMDALAKGDTRLFADAMGEDFTWRLMGTSAHWSKVYEGRDAARNGLFAPLMAQYADRFTNTASHIFADGDHVIVESQGKVTMKSGEPYNNRYCMVIRMGGGKMREVREYFDTALSDARLDASVL